MKILMRAPKDFPDIWPTAGRFKVQVETGEGELLYETAKELKNSVIVEIGTRQGGTAYLLANTLNKIYTIDNYSDPGSNYESALTNLKQFKNVVLLNGYSEAFSKIWGTSIDLLFIDADHSYEGCKSDVENWLQFVKKGSPVLFHDFGSHTGITKFVNEILEAGLIEKVKQEQSMLLTIKK